MAKNTRRFRGLIGQNGGFGEGILGTVKLDDKAESNHYAKAPLYINRPESQCGTGVVFRISSYKELPYHAELI